jgi:hypothetical protein
MRLALLIFLMLIATAFHAWVAWIIWAFNYRLVRDTYRRWRDRKRSRRDAVQ